MKPSDFLFSSKDVYFLAMSKDKTQKKWQSAINEHPSTWTVDCKYHIHLKKKELLREMADCKLGAGNVQEGPWNLIMPESKDYNYQRYMTSHPKNTGTNLKELSLVQNEAI